MTNDEIDNRIEQLQMGDSNDAEINGLTEIVRDLQRERDKTIFRLSWEDVDGVAKEKGLETDLDAEEEHVFLKCVESGLSCWAEVVELALMAATSERSGS